MPRITEPRPSLLSPEALGKLPKHRRDWLEIYGNQWGTRKHGAEPLTDEEKRALADALNPFKRVAAPQILTEREQAALNPFKDGKGRSTGKP